MRKFLTPFLLLYSVLVQAQLKPAGMLLDIKNADTKITKSRSLVSARDGNSPVELTFQTSTCIGVNRGKR